MGNRGDRAPYKAAVWLYLQSVLGRTATPVIAARLMDLPEPLTGAGPYSEAEVHSLRVHLEHFARKCRISRRVFVAYSREG